TKFAGLKSGDSVNLEPSLRLSDILSGHLVAGHVDGVGRIARRETEGETLVFTVSYPADLAPFLVQKGSIAVDGVSLTVGAVDNETFKVYVIPHTATITSLGEVSVGDPVNLEIDLIARYVERQLSLR